MKKNIFSYVMAFFTLISVSLFLSACGEGLKVTGYDVFIDNAKVSNTNNTLYIDYGNTIDITKKIEVKINYDNDTSEIINAGDGGYTYTVSPTMAQTPAVGTYVVSISYGDYGAITVNVVVKEVTISPTIAITDNTLVYGESLALPTVAGNTNNGAVTYYYNTTNSTTGGTELTAETKLNVGNYFVYAKVASTATTSEAYSNVVAFSVEKKALAVPTLSGEYTYTGSLQTAVLTGFDAETMEVSNNTRTEAGSQNITVALKNATNYKWEGDNQTVSISWTIAKANNGALVLTCNNSQWAETYTYNGGTYAIGVTGALGTANSVITVGASTDTGIATINNNVLTVTKTGTITIKANNAGDANYKSATEVVNVFNIAKGTYNNALSFSESELTKVYEQNGKFTNPITNDKLLDVTYSSSAPTIASVNETTGEVTMLGVTTGTDVIITATFAGNDLWNGTTASYSVSIAIAGITPTIALEDAEIIFGESLALPAVAGNTNNGAVTYYYNTTNSTTGGTELTAETKLNVGNYFVYAKVASTATTSEAYTNVVEFSVDKKALAVPTLSGEYTFTGSLQTAILTGFDAETMEVSNNTRTEAGSQNIAVALKDATNYKWTGDNQTVSISWTIAKANNATLVLTCNNDSEWAETYTYNGDTYAIDVTGSLGTSNSVITVGDLADTGEATINNNVLTVTKAGTITIKANNAGDDNYKPATEVVQVMTVAKGTLSADKFGYAVLTRQDDYVEGIKFTNPLTNTESVVVTYSSSNTEVATINASTGEVSIIGVNPENPLTITATFAGNNVWSNTTATYTICYSPNQISDANFKIDGTVVGSDAIAYNGEEFALSTDFQSNTTYTIMEGGSGTASIGLSGNTLVLTAVGTVIVKIDIAQTNLNNAYSTNKTITFIKGTVSLKFDEQIDNTPLIISKLTTSEDFTISATVSKVPQSSLTYSSSNTEVATINSATGEVSILKSSGEDGITISVNYLGSSLWNSATASYTLKINKAVDPNMEEYEIINTAYINNMTLSDITLLANYTWDDSTQIVKLGSFEYSATYTPLNTELYQIVSLKITINATAETISDIILDDSAENYELIQYGDYDITKITSLHDDYKFGIKFAQNYGNIHNWSMIYYNSNINIKQDLDPSYYSVVYKEEYNDDPNKEAYGDRSIDYLYINQSGVEFLKNGNYDKLIINLNVDFTSYMATVHLINGNTLKLLSRYNNPVEFNTENKIYKKASLSVDSLVLNNYNYYISEDSDFYYAERKNNFTITFKNGEEVIWSFEYDYQVNEINNLFGDETDLLNGSFSIPGKIILGWGVQGGEYVIRQDILNDYYDARNIRADAVLYPVTINPFTVKFENIDLPDKVVNSKKEINDIVKAYYADFEDVYFLGWTLFNSDDLDYISNLDELYKNVVNAEVTLKADCYPMSLVSGTDPIINNWYNFIDDTTTYVSVSADGSFQYYESVNRPFNQYGNYETGKIYTYKKDNVTKYVAIANIYNLELGNSYNSYKPYFDGDQLSFNYTSLSQGTSKTVLWVTNKNENNFGLQYYYNLLDTNSTYNISQFILDQMEREELPQIYSYPDFNLVTTDLTSVQLTKKEYGYYVTDDSIISTKLIFQIEGPDITFNINNWNLYYVEIPEAPKVDGKIFMTWYNEDNSICAYDTYALLESLENLGSVEESYTFVPLYRDAVVDYSNTELFNGGTGTFTYISNSIEFPINIIITLFVDGKIEISLDVGDKILLKGYYYYNESNKQLFTKTLSPYDDEDIYICEVYNYFCNSVLFNLFGMEVALTKEVYSGGLIGQLLVMPQMENNTTMTILINASGLTTITNVHTGEAILAEYSPNTGNGAWEFKTTDVEGNVRYYFLVSATADCPEHYLVGDTELIADVDGAFMLANNEANVAEEMVKYYGIYLNVNNPLDSTLYGFYPGSILFVTAEGNGPPMADYCPYFTDAEGNVWMYYHYDSSTGEFKRARVVLHDMTDPETSEQRLMVSLIYYEGTTTEYTCNYSQIKLNTELPTFMSNSFDEDLGESINARISVLLSMPFVTEDNEFKIIFSSDEDHINWNDINVTYDHDNDETTPVYTGKLSYLFDLNNGSLYIYASLSYTDEENVTTYINGEIEFDIELNMDSGDLEALSLIFNKNVYEVPLVG